MMVEFQIGLWSESRNTGPTLKRGKPSQMGPRDVAELAARVFGMTSSEMDSMLAHGGAMIRCSAESFVRWQLERRDAGAINRFRELEVRIVDEADPSPPRAAVRDEDIPRHVREIPLVTEGEPRALFVPMTHARSSSK